MNDKSRKFLTDISIAINMVETFCKDTISFESYQRDAKTKSAVERQLAIIGEAVSKLVQSDSGIQLTKTKEIINFRNRAVHAYDSIDDSIVWAIINIHLPVLKTEVAQLLG